MNEHYSDAYERHFEDANLLFHNARWANAEYLYGLSVECGIKALQRAVGQTVRRQHLPNLMQNINHFEFRKSGRTSSRYLLPREVRDAFNDWDVSQRYQHRRQFTMTIAQRRKYGAEAMHKLVEQVRKDGWPL